MNAQRPPKFVLAVLLFSIMLSGCGQSPLTPVAAPELNALKGNWLLAGSLPVSGPLFPLPQQFGLTMTLDVSNGEVLADMSFFYPCSNGGVGGSGALPLATIAADGSFTLQTSQVNTLVPTVVLSVHGKAPQAAGGNWTGTYTATNSSPGCLPVSGTFTAAPIQAIGGTFLGVGTLGPQNAPAAPASSMTMSFVQGGPASLAPPLYGSPVNSESALSGTIQVTGSSCFTSGTANIPSGSVLGDNVEEQFAMNDGSRLLLHGSVTDVAASTIKLSSLLVVGGACDNWFGYSGSVLTRQ